MIGQNLYYLNNKKYCTTFSNLDTVLHELNSFYHTSNPRKLVFVEMDMRRENSGNFARDSVEDKIRQNTPDSRVVVEWKNFDEADDITYLENSDKAILIFSDDDDHLNILGRYVAGLLKASNFWPTLSNEEHRDKAADFVDKIVEADWMFNYIRVSEDLTDIPAYVKNMINTHGLYANTFQNGANFSYDLLFYLNDYHTNASVQNLIKEKLTF